MNIKLIIILTSILVGGCSMNQNTIKEAIDFCKDHDGIFEIYNIGFASHAWVRCRDNSTFRLDNIKGK